MAETAPVPFVDTHVHVNFIMKQFNEALVRLAFGSLNFGILEPLFQDTFEPFVERHFREASGGGWEASVHVCCDPESHDVSLDYVTRHPKLFGAFGPSRRSTHYNLYLTGKFVRNSSSQCEGVFRCD